MSQHGGSSLPKPAAGHPYAAEIDAERAGWIELVTLVRSLSVAECLKPGYYRDPDWTVRDMVAHVGTWLAEAENQLERIRAGTYTGHEIDVDAVNAQMLEAMRDQPWEIAWSQANAARTLMLQDWYALSEPNEEAAWWIRKAGGDHYAQHLLRLREWVPELIALRR